MKSLCFFPLICLLLVLGCAARPFYPLPSKVAVHHKKPIQTTRPYNVAHRGSNGEIPEETAPAYMRAIQEGADFIETDILASKDGVLICFHDVTLDETTDIADHKKFANRRTTYDVQGVNTTGWFIVDFTLEELKLLRVKQRYPFRDQQYNEFISIALDAPRVVGIYPEIKNPVLINQHHSSAIPAVGTMTTVIKYSAIITLDTVIMEIVLPNITRPQIIWLLVPTGLTCEVKWPNGKRFEDKFVEMLKKYEYKGSYMSREWLKQPVFIQSFAPTSLVYISNLTDSPKIFLIDDVDIPTQDTNQSYWEITSDSYLNYIKEYVLGIGPWKDTVVPVVNNYLEPPTDLVARAHALNLQVHPYTYRNENEFLHFNFSQDPYKEYDYWLEVIGVDGLFTDFTGSLHNYQELASPLSPQDDDIEASNILNKVAQLLASFGKN